VAEAVTPAGQRDDAPPGRARDDAARPAGERARRSPHARKFALLTGALIGIAIGALALAVALVAAGHGKGSARWSSWRPREHGATAAQEIANHVAPNYRLPSGAQLVTVTGGALKIADLPAHLAQRTSGGATSVLQGDTVLFTLCGDGARCSIEGKPSGERALLLYREGLELALYAFHYLHADYVVALMPPTYVLPPVASGTSKRASVKVKPTSTALLLRRDDFKDVIGQPLDATLPPPAPSVATVARTTEAPLVGTIGRNAVFGVRFVQAQDASAVVLLEPLAR
jgi:hypothetical protein